MKLWTIQPVEFYEELYQKDVIYTSSEFIDPSFKRAYKWLIPQMEQRIGKRPFKNAYPIWAWFQFNGQLKKRPDLRLGGYLPKGQKGVRIEFEKKESHVLLSDFDLWHYVLNFFYLADDEQQDETINRIFETKKIPFGNARNYPSELKKIIEDSWPKIFDMSYEFEYSSLAYSKKSIQATFWSLKKEEIKKVDFFTGR